MRANQHDLSLKIGSSMVPSLLGMKEPTSTGIIDEHKTQPASGEESLDWVKSKIVSIFPPFSLS